MFSKIIITCVLLIAVTKCDMYLKLKMESFHNPHGIKQNLKPCFNSSNGVQKCLTYFRFCLTTSSQTSRECLSEFKTQIIGENTITSEQFKLTTNSIVFPIIGNEQSNLKQLNLFVEVYNDLKEENEKSQLISEWKIDSIVLNGKINEWSIFSQFNEILSQQMTFNFELECFSNYEGPFCQKPVCSSGCNTLNGGGYCTKPNECLCKPGWSGERCDEKLSQLQIEATTKCNIECKNGGKCQINSSGIAHCKCEANLFKGDLCQIKVILDMCLNDHCLNGGSCLANGECLCPPGYAGERCQTKRLTSQCGLVTCYNGGTCFIDNQNEYACMCHHLFTGKFCETKFETTTTTKVNIQTSSSSPKTASTVKNILLNIESTKHETEKNGFSLQEIALIVLAGLGMPIFAILIVVLLYRINANRKPNENMKHVQIENGRLSKIAVENIYVECNNGRKKATNQIKDSNTVIEIKDKKAQNDSFTNLKTNITQYTNEKVLNDNNIYSIIDFSNENNSTTACVLNAQEIYKNFGNKNANLHEYQVTFV